MKNKIEKIIVKNLFNVGAGVVFPGAKKASNQIMSTLIKEILKVLPKEEKQRILDTNWHKGYVKGFNDSISDCKSAISKLLK